MIYIMAKLKIKFPTLLTGALISHHQSYYDMIKEIKAKVNAYSGQPLNQKVVISYRGKKQKKIIRNISTTQFLIDRVPVLRIEMKNIKLGCLICFLNIQVIITRI